MSLSELTKGLQEVQTFLSENKIIDVKEFFSESTINEVLATNKSKSFDEKKYFQHDMLGVKLGCYLSTGIYTLFGNESIVNLEEYFWNTYVPSLGLTKEQVIEGTLSVKQARQYQPALLNTALKMGAPSCGYDYSKFLNATVDKEIYDKYGFYTTWTYPRVLVKHRDYYLLSEDVTNIFCTFDRFLEFLKITLDQNKLLLMLKRFNRLFLLQPDTYAEFDKILYDQKPGLEHKISQYIGTTLGIPSKKVIFNEQFWERFQHLEDVIIREIKAVEESIAQSKATQTTDTVQDTDATQDTQDKNTIVDSIENMVSATVSAAVDAVRTVTTPATPATNSAIQNVGNIFRSLVKPEAGEKTFVDNLLDSINSNLKTIGSIWDSTCKKSATEEQKSATEEQKSATEEQKSATEEQKSATEEQKSATEEQKSPIHNYF